MIYGYDKSVETVVQSCVPNWTELRARKSDFVKLDNNTFKSLSFMLVVEPSLLCFTDSKNLVTPRIEYFPICVERIESKAYEFAQITLARAGGQSDLEQRVQWLFNKPRLRLLDSEEELTGGMGLKPQTYTLRFYGGLEIADAGGQGSLCITASDLPDLVS